MSILPYGGIVKPSDAMDFFNMEIWVKINGLEMYEVSNLGNVRNQKGLIISSQVTNSGYKIVHLHSKGKRVAKTIHRLVAIHFCNPPSDYELMQVDHIDCNKQNNYFGNLRWVTKKQNNRLAWDNGLHEKTREKARQRMVVLGRKNGDLKRKVLKERHLNERDFFLSLCRSNAKMQRKAVYGVNKNGDKVFFNSIREGIMNGFANINHSIKNGTRVKGYVFFYA